MFRDLERTQTVLTGLAAHLLFGVNLAHGGSSEGGDALMVSGSYFQVLGLQPALGRLLAPHDEREKAGGNVVVLSDEFWQRRFGGRRDVLDDTLVVNGQAMSIVGVLPRGFHGTTLGERPLVYVPISMGETLVPRWRGLDNLANRRNYWAYLFGRRKPGVSIEQAQAALNVEYRSIITKVEVPLQKDMSPAVLGQFRARELQLTPGYRGQSTLHTQAASPLKLLLTVAFVVLLICCANVANLLLGRAATRSTEMAVRLSIGAGRRHIVGQLLLESVLLAVIGGTLGLLVARWTLEGIFRLLPEAASQTLSPALDLPMLLFGLALSCATGLLFGLFPAIHCTRPNLVSALRATAGQPSGAKAAARFRVVLATTQIAMSMALLIAAGLFTKSLLNIARVDLGLDRDRLVVFSVAPTLNGYTPERTRAIYEQIEDAFSVLPGVTGVSASMVRLIEGSNWGSGFSVQGFAAGPDTDTSSMYNYVGPDFLRTLAIPLIAGREFSRQDTLGGPKVAIVNEAFVRKFNLGRDAVGRRMRMGSGTELDTEIVGVARSAAYSEVKGETLPVVTYPYRQQTSPTSMNFYVRTSAREDELMAAIPQTIRKIDPTLPIGRVGTMSAQVQENVALDRFVASLSAAFAALATLLAALGLYGVLAYTVTQRTREFGLRMALGADGANVRRLVLRQVAWMTCVGAAAGLVASLAVGRAAESLLFQMNARDPFVFTAATAALALVALTAGLIPAQRAARVDPMTALRYE
jgi:predicted permease